MQTYKIRPHHGLCIRFFEGKGYSQEFVENMTRLIAMGTSKETESVKFTITYGLDSLCSACPNNEGNVCISQQKVERLDRLVVEHCGLVEGMEITMKELLEQVEKHIVKAGKFHQVCSNCTWYEEICSKK